MTTLQPEILIGKELLRSGYYMGQCSVLPNKPLVRRSARVRCARRPMPLRRSRSIRCTSFSLPAECFRVLIPPTSFAAASSAWRRRSNRPWKNDGT